ncbi:hypothetical protein GQE99_14595 [Maritimibacter sp. DP07]|uniref:Uncharacterized protein n=1 Tax=Maritimibacter harenae TaxID=2606218 RepID=A0A845M5F4_9RHOB|nr:hypothetical protein [Maritimibacter harenae]MZR14249.1 hypothetical protein [Maritimibacter harenae]
MKLDHGPWAYPPRRRPSTATRILTSGKLVLAIILSLILAHAATTTMGEVIHVQIGGLQ